MTEDEIVIVVRGGVAEVHSKPPGVNIRIVDVDNGDLLESPTLLEIAESILVSASGAHEKQWTWSGVDDAENYIHQGSVLGDTLIVLDDTYEGAWNDTSYVSLACKQAPILARHTVALLGLIDVLEMTGNEEIRSLIQRYRSQEV